MTVPDEIWTIGHWTHPPQVFLELLAGAGIDAIADVRAHPGSRTSPQYGADVLPGWLERAGVGYSHRGDLGGRRPKQDVDPRCNAGWHNRSFKNYADYTLTPPYEAGIEALRELAGWQRVAYLCAEAMPWRCHRLLISNTLAARGWTVRHIVPGPAVLRHELGRWGAPPHREPGGRLTYPADSPADGGPGAASS